MLSTASKSCQCQIARITWPRKAIISRCTLASVKLTKRLNFHKLITLKPHFLKVPNRFNSRRNYFTIHRRGSSNGTMPSSLSRISARTGLLGKVIWTWLNMSTWRTRYWRWCLAGRMPPSQWWGSMNKIHSWRTPMPMDKATNKVMQTTLCKI